MSPNPLNAYHIPSVADVLAGRVFTVRNPAAAFSLPFRGRQAKTPAVA